VRSTIDQGALHQEGVIRLRMGGAGTMLAAGDFIPMAAQLHLAAQIDVKVAQLALAQLRDSTGDIAINLSIETITDFNFHHQLVELLQANSDICSRLSFEVLENGVFKQLDAFWELAQAIRPLGCCIGIDYFGQHLVEVGKLAAMGLDYVKVHPNYVRGLSQNPGNQEFLRGLCKVVSHLGIAVIALGVDAEDELPLLASLGFDGFTGPGIK
jgi:EAL domain-containing protein (putative c-di-GMP-specific phosphodiesterase class I)